MRKIKRIQAWLPLIAILLARSALASISMDVATSTVSPCDSDVYTITVSNPVTETENLTEMVIVLDRKTVEFQFLDNSTLITTPNNGDLSGNSADPAIAGTLLTWDLDTLFGSDVELAPGESLTILLTINYSCSASSNVASVSLDGERPRDVAIAQEKDIFSITVEPGVATVKVVPARQTITIETIPDDDLAGWTIEIENSGIGNIYNISIDGVFGTGLDYVPNSAEINGNTLSPADVTGSSITWDMNQFLADPDGGGGLDDLNGDGNFGDLAPGEKFTISNVQAQMIGCGSLILEADVSFGGNDGAVCYDSAVSGETSAGSIKVIRVDPSISYIFDGAGNLDGFDYCGGVENVTLVISNAVSAGQARNFEFEMDGWPTGFTISNVSSTPAGTTYNPVTTTFENIPDIAGGTSVTIEFDVDWTGGGDPCSTADTSASLLLLPSYTNVCGDAFFPPVTLDSVSVGDRRRLGMTATKEVTSTPEGPLDRVDVGDDGIEFILTVELTGDYAANASFDETLDIVDTIPPNWTIVDANGGAVGGGGTTITWNHRFDADDPATYIFTKSTTLDATEDPCDAGATVSNSFNVEGVTVSDCRGCTYTVGGNTASASLYINLDTATTDPLDSSDKSVSYVGTQTGNQGEACRDIQYTVTYDFSEHAPASWSGITLTEKLERVQSLSTLVTVSYNGVDYGPSGTGHITILGDVTDNSPTDFVVDFSDLDSVIPSIAPDDGHVLVIEFTTSTVMASEGAAVQFSSLCLSGVTSGCIADPTYKEGIPVSIGSQNMGVGINGPVILEHCSVNTHTISVSKSDDFFTYDPVVTIDLDPDNDGIPNYGYIPATTVFDGNWVDSDDNTFGSFEPTTVGSPVTQLVWDFSVLGTGDFKTVADFDIDLRFTCSEDAGDSDDDAVSATLAYNTYCDDDANPQEESASASYNPPANRIIGPQLVVLKTPQNLYVTEEQGVWSLNVTNTGYGAAYNVALIDMLGTGINYISADIAETAVNGQEVIWRFQLAADPDGAGTGLEDLDGDGFYDDLAPGETATVTMTVEFNDCDSANLGDEITAYASCDIEAANPLTASWNGVAYCNMSNTSSAVAKMAPSSKIAVDSFGGPIQICDAQFIRFLVKNTGQGHTYDVNAKQIFPAEIGGEMPVLYLSGQSSYEVDADGDGVYETTVDPGPDPGQGTGTAANPYLWDKNDIPAFADMAPNAAVRITYFVDATCAAAESDLKFISQAEWRSACGEGKTTSQVQGTLLLQDMNVDVTIESRNVTAGEAFSTNSLAGGSGDDIEYRVTLTSNGDIGSQNMALTVVVPEAAVDEGSISFSQNPPDNLATADGTAANPYTWGPSTIGAADGVADDTLATGSSFVTIYQLSVDGCTNDHNSATSSWGCNAGGGCVSGTSTRENLFTVEPQIVAADITQTITDLSAAGNPDTNGIIELTIPAIEGSARNILLTNTLPTEFSIDDTFAATVSSSDGSLSHVVVGGSATIPTFALYSDAGTVGSVDPQENILRDGESATVTFYIYQSGSLDATADADVREETIGNGLDPASPPDDTNEVDVYFQDTCGIAQPQVANSQTVSPETADLDIDISGDLVRIVNRAGDTETFAVVVTNRGETTAANTTVTITIADGWSGAVPGGCSGSVPGTVTCDVSGLGPGASQTITFNLTVDNETDPLTFSAQVEGDIEKQDGTDTSGNYSFDTIRARIIGFRMTKTLQSTSEPDSESAGASVLIGEEATWRIEAIWFGGGSTISNVTLTDTLPNGQGYVSESVDPDSNNEATVNATTNPGQVDGGTITWNLNDIDTSTGPQSFTVDVVSRILNDPDDSEGTPNQNGATSSSVADISFDYESEIYDNSSPGFPAAADRTVDLTIETPELTITKKVRNVTQDNPAGAGNYADSVTAVAGDVLEYCVSMQNAAGRSKAYNLVLTDTLPGKVTAVDPASDGIDNDGDGSTDEADEGVASTTGGGATPLVMTFDETAGSNQLAELASGDSVVLVYWVTVDLTVISTTVYTNIASVSLDTLPGATGSQSAPTGTTGDADGARIYTADDIASFEIPEVPSEKSITAVSSSGLAGAAPYTGSDQIVAVGEEIRYSLTFNIPPSTFSESHIADDLPTGLTAVGGEADNLVVDADDPDVTVYDKTVWNGGIPTGPAETGLITISPTVGVWSYTDGGGTNRSGNGVLWDMSNYVFIFSAPKTFPLEFIARVDNIGANRYNTVLDNTDAQLDFYNEDTSAVVQIELNDVPVTVQEPSVGAHKTFSPDSGLDAGDTVTVTVSVINESSDVPAYNVDIYDNLAALNLSYAGNITGDTPDTVFTFDTSPTPVLPVTPTVNSPVFRFNSLAPAPGGAKTFTFDAVLTMAVEPLEVIDNTVEVVWTSLPNDDTALNSGGTIGTDGSSDGMRNGNIPLDAGINNYETSAIDSATTNPLTAAKEDLGFADAASGFTENAIGARRKFRITIDLPEGTTRLLTIIDDLNAGDASWVLENDAAYDISYTLTDIHSINGETDLADTGAIETAIEFSNGGTDVPADETSGTARWNLGTIVTKTPAEDDVPGGGTISPQIIIEYYCRINNDTATDATDDLINSATVTYADGESGGTAGLGPYTTTNTVIEPLLSLTKSTTDDGIVEAGDIVEYLITLSNISSYTAYDPVIVDTLDVGETIDTNWTGDGLDNDGDGSTDEAGEGTAGDGTEITVSGDGRLITFRTLHIAAGVTRQFRYRTTVDADVIPAQQIDNVAEAYWSSQPGGLEGSASGTSAERTGSDGFGGSPNDYNTDEAISAVRVDSAVPDPSLSKSPDVIRELAIGADASYNITIDLPAGQTDITNVVDTIPAGIVVTDVSVTGLNGTTVTTSFNSPGDIPAHDGTAALDITIPLGGAGGDADPISGNLLGITDIQIDITAHVANIAANIADGDTASEEIMDNSAALNYLESDGAGGTQPATKTDTSQGISVEEPDLTITKLVTNFTDPGNAPDAGDELEYTLTIVNAGNPDTGQAFDVGIVDVLAAGQSYVSSSTSATLDGAPFGLINEPSDNPSGTLKWGRDNETGADMDIDIPAGQVFELTYRVTVDDTVEPAQILSNDAAINWSSRNGDQSPGAADGERDGSGSVNDYTASDDVSIAADDSNTINKGRNTDTYGAGDADVRVGDVITYHLDVTLQEGTTVGVVVTDVLHAGLEFVDTVSINGDTAAPYTSAGTFTHADIAGASAPAEAPPGTLTWTLGDITNAGDNNAGNNVFRIVYRARVRNEVAIVRPTTAAENTATLAYKLAGGDDATPETDTETVTVQQPILSVGKTSNPADGSTNLVQGQAVDFTITVANTGTAPAYDVVIDDVIPVGMRAGGIHPATGVRTVSITVNGGAVGSPDEPVATGTFAADGAIRWDLDDDVTADTYTINPGQSLVLVYRVNVDSTIGAGVEMTNSAEVAHYYSFDDDAIPAGSVLGDRRDYGSVGPEEVTLTTDSPGDPSKSDVATATIGEEMTYTISVPAVGNTVNATLYDVEVIDTLPFFGVNTPRVDVVSAAFTAGSSVNAGASINLVGRQTNNILNLMTAADGIDIPPNGRAIVELTVRVRNITENQAGGTFTNQVSYTYEREDGGSGAVNGGSDTTAATTIQEPSLSITKTVATAGSDAGDTVEYELAITNAAGGTISTAYDIVITDTLDSSLQYVGASVVGAIIDDDSSAGQTVDVTLDELAPGATATVTIEAVVRATAQPGEVIDNDATIQWSSLDGVLAGDEGAGEDEERTGTGAGGAGAANDYVDNDTVQFTLDTPTIDKSDPSAATAPIGQTIDYTITVTMTEGVTNNVVITDYVPAGFGYVSHSVDTSGFNGALNKGTATDTIPAVGADGADLILRWDSITTTDDSNAGNDSFDVDVTLRVLNVIGNQDGITLENTAELTYDDEGGTPTDVAAPTPPAAVTVTEPDLTMVKSITSPSPLGPLDAGDTITYELVVQHSGASTADAFDVLITDLLDAGSGEMVIEDAGDISVVTSDPSVSEDSAPARNGGNTGFTAQYDIPLGESVTITYIATLQDSVQPGDTLANDADVAWASLDGNPAEARDGSDGEGGALDDYADQDNYQAVTTKVPTDPVKTRVSDTYDEGDDSLDDDAVRIGEQITYRIQFILPEGTTNNLTVNDILPGGFAYIADVSVTPASGTNGFTYSLTSPTAGDTDTITWNFGTVTNAGGSGGNTVTIEYQVRVEDDAVDLPIPPPTQTSVNNSAVLNYNDASGTPQTTLAATTSAVVKQPAPSVTKGFNGPDPSPIEAGETVLYTFTVTNSGDAPAYNMVIQDNLPDGMRQTAPDNFIETLNGVDVTGAVSRTYTAATGVIEWTFTDAQELDFNAPNNTFVVTFDAHADNDLAASSALTNTVEVVEHFSKPSSDPTQRRTYAALSDNVISTADDPSPATKTPAGTGTIGEEITYTISVPGGPSTVKLYDVEIYDTLPTFADTTLRVDVLSVAYNPASPLQPAGVLNGTPTGNTLTLIDENDSIDIAATEQIIIDVTLRIKNDARNSAGESFINAADFTYESSEGGTDNKTIAGATPATTTIVEPALTFDYKTVTNITNPGNPPDAGDLLEYEVKIDNSNVNASTAFDVNIVDTLEVGLQFDSMVVGSDIAVLPDTSGDGSPGSPQTLLWGREQAVPTDIDIVAGGTITLIYRVKVRDDVEPVQSLDNSVVADWRSLDNDPDPGAVDSGRDGSDGAGGSPNNYKTAAATAGTTTADTNTITKTRNTDTYGAGDADLRIGDIVTYYLDLEMQEGKSDQLGIGDMLPAGLVFVDTVSINGDTTAPYSDAAPFTYADIAAVETPSAGATGAVNWTLGDISNTGDNNAGNNTFRIIYRVQVADEVLAQTPTTQNLQNTAMLDYQLADGTAAPQESDTETVTVKQPLLSIAKSANPANGGIVQQGDSIQYTVTVTNNGDVTAYDPQIRDVIPEGIRGGGIAGITVNSITVNGVGVATKNPEPNATFATDGIALWDLNDAGNYAINPSETLVLVYTITIDGDIGAGVVLTNDARVEDYFSFDDNQVPAGAMLADRESYGTSTAASTTHTTDTPAAPSKSGVASATIGEEITYTIKVPADGNTVNATLYDVEITDQLPALPSDATIPRVDVVSVVYAATSDVNASSDITGSVSLFNTTLTIIDATDSVDIPPNGQAILNLTVRVKNHADNQDGQTFANQISYTYEQTEGSSNDINGGSDTTSDTSIYEPGITVEKDIINVTGCGSPPEGKLPYHAPHPNDTMRYTVTLTNTGSSTAYDINIIDTLDAGVSYVAGSTNLTTASAAFTTLAEPEVSGNVLTWGRTQTPAQKLDLGTGETVVFTYDVTVDTVVVRDSIDNNLSVDWTSLDGADANERDGGGGVNDYVDGDVSQVDTWGEPVDFMIPGGNTSIADDGTVSGATSGSVDGHSELILADGVDVTITGNGVPNENEPDGDPLPFGTLSVTVSANAAATITSDGTGAFSIDRLVINDGGTVTLVGDTIYDIGSLQMGVGSAVIIPDGSILMVYGNAVMTGSDGKANHAAIRPDVTGGGINIIFNCAFSGIHIHFPDIGSGSVTYNGPTSISYGVFRGGTGIEPYITYTYSDPTTWDHLAFRADTGKTITIENTDSTGTGIVTVDTYMGPVDAWMGGDITENENPGTVDWLNATPCRNLTATLSNHADGGVLVSWITEAEHGVYKFVVERRKGANGWEIAGETFSDAEEYQGADYAFHDTGAEAGTSYEYSIAAVDINGVSRDWPAGSIVALRSVKKETISLRSVTAAEEENPVLPPSATVTEVAGNVADYASDTPVQAGTARRAEIAETGLYSVPEAGGLYNLGQQLPRLPGDLVFVRGLNDFYTDTNAIWRGDLQIDGTPGTVPQPPVHGIIEGDSFIGIFHTERNESFTVNPYLPPGPNWFFGRDYELHGGSARQVTAEVLSPLPGGEAVIKVAVRATSPGDHDLGIEINGMPVARGNWNGGGHYLIEATFASDLLVNGPNTVNLYTETDGSTKRLDYIDILTPATPVLRDGKLLVQVSSTASAVTVDNASYAVDVTQFGAEKLLSISSGTVGGLQAGQMVFFCTAPETLTWSDAQQLSTDGFEDCNYIAVAPESMLSELQPLIEKRRADGYNAKAVSLEQVLDVFGGGIFGPTGLVRISQYLKPANLLLAAGTTYDCKGYEGMGTPRGIPCGYVHVYEGLAASDDLYTDGFETAVGRLPARTAAELSNIVQKLIVYEPGNQVAMLADADDIGSDFDRFAALQRELTDILPSTLIEATDRSTSDVRSELFTTIQNGAKLVTYQGHGGAEYLGYAGNRILGTEHCSSVPPSAWLLSTCLTGSYIVNNPATPVLARDLLVTPGNGAVTAFCSTRYGDASVEHEIVRESLRHMAGGSATWGDVLLHVKRALAGTETADIYTLLGDPALKTVNIEEQRAIAVLSPQAGSFVRAPVTIQFRLLGNGWASEVLQLFCRRNNGMWMEIGTVQTEVGVVDYEMQWTPPADGHGYQIMIREVE